VKVVARFRIEEDWFGCILGLVILALTVVAPNIFP